MVVILVKKAEISKDIVLPTYDRVYLAPDDLVKG